MPLGREAKNAWIAFVVAYQFVRPKIGRALSDAGQVSLELYEALLALEEAPSGSLRMSELAEQTQMTRSGMTRLADRLESDGFIERHDCEKDRRGSYAVLTDKGRAAREAAWPVYRDAVEEHFGKLLTKQESLAVASALRKVTDDTCRLIGWE